MLYAKSLWLRNCGRFTHVSSDFGAQYHTHVFVTSEALYASLTRSATWRHENKFIDLKADALKPTTNYFFCDYDVEAKPIWFTPGLFVDETSNLLPKQQGKVVDKNDFNVIDEGYPGTGGPSRKYHSPTYGQIESVLPDHQMLTHAFSPCREELASFSIGQTFMLGKKRTMFQVVKQSELIEGRWKHGECMTDWLEYPTDYGSRFSGFEILAATMRYIILRGTVRDDVDYVELPLPDQVLRLPDFYLQRIPFEIN